MKCRRIPCMSRGERHAGVRQAGYQLFGTLLACANDPGIGLQFLIEELSLHAQALAFAERLANPPIFRMRAWRSTQGDGVLF